MRQGRRFGVVFGREVEEFVEESRASIGWDGILGIFRL
jgi:hypothetical protein